MGEVMCDKVCVDLLAKKMQELLHKDVISSNVIIGDWKKLGHVEV